MMSQMANPVNSDSESLSISDKKSVFRKTDRQDALALYQCLSIPLTSESEFSGDEYCVPKVSEIVDAEKVVIEEKAGEEQNVASSSLADSNSLKRKKIEFDHNGLFEGDCPLDVNKKKVKRNAKQDQGQQGFLQASAAKIPLLPFHKDCHSEGSQVNVNELEREAKIQDLALMKEDATNDYEASEDCSSDNDVPVMNKPTRRKRTASGSSIPVFECPFPNCKKEFNRPSKLNEHKRLHTSERPFKCSVEGCGRTYTRQQHLKRHIATAHSETKPQEFLECNVCHKLFSNKYSLAKHQYRAHERQNYTCEDCGKIFRKQQHLRSHSFEHTGIKSYSCTYPGCSAGFNILSRFKRHALQHIKECYACPIETCELTFDLYGDLQKHLAECHPKVCDVCGRMFRQLRQLKIHRETHDDVREAFFCPAPNCDRYFYIERNLNAHYRSQHEQTLIYQCGICDLRLSTKQKLAFHMFTHSPSYKRNYYSDKPRRPRKDKGVSRTDYARLLSGYSVDMENAEEHSSEFEVEAGSSQQLEEDHSFPVPADPSNSTSDVVQESSMVQVNHQIENNRPTEDLDSCNSEQEFKQMRSEDDMGKLLLSSEDARDTDN